MAYGQHLDDLDLKPEGYYANVRPEMMAFIPRKARTVLEVGCGKGVFAAQVKKLTGAEVWGIEISPEAEAQAKKNLDKIIIGDVGVELAKLPAAYFDCVIFNDVLEHLIDPYAVLKTVLEKLSKDGVVVSSIPNIRYFHSLHELLVGKNWEYEDAGILDKTHLRFFTKNSIANMYRRLGYEVVTMQGINPTAHLPWRYKLPNWLLGNRHDDMRYMQFATVARKHGS